jgi:hypothetical protein
MIDLDNPGHTLHSFGRTSPALRQRMPHGSLCENVCGVDEGEG